MSVSVCDRGSCIKCGLNGYLGDNKELKLKLMSFVEEGSRYQRNKLAEDFIQALCEVTPITRAPLGKAAVP